MANRPVVILVAASLLLFARTEQLSCEIQYKTQGSTLQLSVSNQGTFGSLEQVLSYAPWVGGLVDTSASQGFPPLKLVTTGNEGWAGPLYEFYPGSDQADTIWEASLSDSLEPPGWDEYWGEAFPFRPLSDQDFYCRFRDDETAITGHIPLDLDIVQSSYAWDDETAGGIIIVEYRITRTVDQPIDQPWVGFYLEGSQGLSLAGYQPEDRLSYFLAGNPGNPSVGVAVLFSSQEDESLNTSYTWYEGPASPSSDEGRYNLMSSEVILPAQTTPGVARSLLSFGPYTISADTLVIAIALLSGEDLEDLALKAGIAESIYLLGGIPTATDPHYPQPLNFSLFQNFPNPFNPSTEIRFEIAEFVPVSLRVYDLLGREVATLANEPLSAGMYRLRFNRGKLASGVYYYRLTAGANAAVKRMILVR